MECTVAGPYGFESRPLAPTNFWAERREINHAGSNFVLSSGRLRSALPSGGDADFRKGLGGNASAGLTSPPSSLHAETTARRGGER